MVSSEIASQPVQSFWLIDFDYGWQALLEHGRRQVFAKDRILFQQGEKAHSLFLIVEGRVRLVKNSVDGRERHIAVIGRNGLAGDCGMFDPGVHLTSALASADTVCYELSMQALFDAMALDREMLMYLLRFADRRFQIMLHHHELMGIGSALRRVSSVLSGLVRLYGVTHAGGKWIRLNFTQEEIASICSISRVSVSTALADLERCSVIFRQGRKIIVRDQQALWKLVSDIPL